MTDNHNMAHVDPKPDNSSVIEIEILKNKLKLDENIVGLLVNSRDSIKAKSFFNNVINQINHYYC